MFTLYFLRRFYKSFFVFLVLLILILAFGDMLTRLAVLPSVSSIPKLILLMLPLMGVFAVPVASALSVFTVVGQCYQYNEVLIFHFLPRIRGEIYKAIFIFSLSILPLYAFLVFDFAPKSYLEGKKFIVTLAKEHLSQLEPDKFHYLLPNFVIFFQEKSASSSVGGGTEFRKILLMYQGNDKQQYIMTARKGLLDGSVLYLKNGFMQNQNAPNSYLGTFEETQISIEQLFNCDTNEKSIKKIQDKHSKFLTWKDLRLFKNKILSVLIEYHSRIAKILWQLLLPFLSFWVLCIWGRLASNNLVLSILGTTVLFLFTYLHVNIVRIFWISYSFGFLFLYGMIFFVSAFAYFLQQRSFK